MTESTPGSGPVSNRDRARRSLSELYRDSLAQRIVEFEGWLDAFDPTDEEQLDEIRRAAHQLRGSGSSFGFPGITDLGAAVEEAPVDRLRDELAQLADEVRRAVIQLESEIPPIDGLDSAPD